MRFILGVVVGIVLTIGTAYIHDTRFARPVVAGGPPPFVDWNAFFAALGR